ncbi:hypothetical protein K456DRAFT_1925631 [Colletotrichum gloeosporioides 23]|nr:hypothetical protein K456DRAFT_1925631 [Colletotrichum gloeosporioides 23]
MKDQQANGGHTQTSSREGSRMVQKSKMEVEVVVVVVVVEAMAMVSRVSSPFPEDEIKIGPEQKSKRKQASKQTRWEEERKRVVWEDGGRAEARIVRYRSDGGPGSASGPGRSSKVHVLALGPGPSPSPQSTVQVLKTSSLPSRPSSFVLRPSSFVFRLSSIVSRLCKACSGMEETQLCRWDAYGEWSSAGAQEMTPVACRPVRGRPHTLSTKALGQEKAIPRRSFQSVGFLLQRTAASLPLLFFVLYYVPTYLGTLPAPYFTFHYNRHTW